MFRIEPIRREHRTRGFDCGEPSLNDFLTRFALKNDANDIGRTFVATEPESIQVKGYYTISAGSVRFENLPSSLRLPRYPIPTIHLGRLATDLTAQGTGLGEALLFDALTRAVRVSDELGIKVMELIALNDRAKSFYLKYGFEEMADDPHHLYIGIDAIRDLV